MLPSILPTSVMFLQVRLSTSSLAKQAKQPDSESETNTVVVRHLRFYLNKVVSEKLQFAQCLCNASVVCLTLG